MYPAAVPTVTVPEVTDGARVLDVRERGEWDAGHIEGALHVPLDDVPARLDELTDASDAARLVVVCRSGGRSARAVAWLVDNGVDAVNLDGGMGAWAALGRPMVSEHGTPPFVR
jgi:rhodanese-related sulfurtransferase